MLTSLRLHTRILRRCWDKHPSIDAIHTLPSKRIIPMARVLRSAKLDEVWLLPGSFRSAAAPWLARVKRRIGYRRDGRGVLLNDGVTQLDRSQCVSTVQWYAHLVQQITGIDATNTPPMRVIVTDEDRSQAGDVLAAAGDRFAVLVPGANRVDKRWPAERFGAVAAAHSCVTRLSTGHRRCPFGGRRRRGGHEGCP